MGNELTPQPNDLSRTRERSLTSSQKTLAIEMHLTALNAKVTLDSALVREFRHVFDTETPEAIQWAWRAWRHRSPYFPAISDILTLVADWQRGQAEQEELRGRHERRVLYEKARAEGKLVDFAELRAKLYEVAKSKGFPAEPARRLRDYELRTRHVPTIPAVKMTPEEIEGRRNKERVEIERYRTREQGA
jgi:hypothetical protein